MRIDKVAARKSIRLRDREAVLKDYQVANTEAVTGVGAANGNAEIARSVALLDGDAGTVAQYVTDRERRPVVELAAIDGRLRLAIGRLVKQRARHARRDARG